MATIERDLPDRPLDNENEEIKELRRAGFDDVQIKRMDRVRSSIYKGKFSELTPEAKRLQFTKWLYETGKIKR